MEISEIEFSLYLDEKILEFLPERNIHKRHKKYLGIKTPGAMLQIESNHNADDESFSPKYRYSHCKV